MVYQYIAWNEKGEIVKGKLSASDEEAATNLLGYAGYNVINLKHFVPFFSSDRLSAQLFRVKPAEIILFYRQLALLLESGINITTALELLQEQMSNRLLKKVLGEAIADLRSGNQLSTAMSKHPEVFAPIYCRSLSVGEQTGNLETMLRQIADYIEKETTATKEIKNALMYPVITAIVTFIVVGVLVTFVLPAFSSLYDSLGANLPTLTRVVIDSATALRSNGLYILLVMMAGIFGTLTYIKTPAGRYKWHKLLISLPLIGRVNHLSHLSRCCRSIALLFRAGLPLTEIMPLVIQGSSNEVLVQALTDVQQGMLKGEGLSQPMTKNNIFLPMMVQMVKVGEETGNLDTSLIAVAQNYEAEAEDSTRSLIELIQPAMTLMIAVVVGLIALSLVSAMYSVYGQSL
ncbi:type II secretion system F family protein [Chloroflexota bacterium]